MILPKTYTVALLIMILGLLAQGSWANFFRAGGVRKQRFELMYFDFAFAALIVALVAGFTLGNLGFDGFTLMDDFVRAGKRQWIQAFAAGCLLNLAMMLLVSAISVAGIAMPVLISASVAAAYFDTNNSTIVYILLAAVAAASGVFYKLKPVLLSVASGLVMTGYIPLIDKARFGDIGMGPYSGALMVSFAVVFSTFVYNLFFMNLPVAGEPLEFLDYIRGGLAPHRLGAIAGAIWGIALVAFFAVWAASDAKFGKPEFIALSQGGAILAAIWGLTIWKENPRGWILLASFAAALGVLVVS
jgi:glucose uptake protein